MSVTPYYSDDWVTIYHGDCREIIPTIEFQCVFADPPYHVGLEYASYEDNMGTQDHWDVWLDEWLWPCVSRCAAVAVTPGYKNLWRYPEPDGMFVRFDRTAQSPSGVAWMNKWEPLLLYGKVLHRPPWDVIETAAQSERARDPVDHPCPKPLSLMRKIIPSISELTDVVLDPFSGSGGTLRAAKDLGRKSIGIEIEERYCEIAAQRCAQEVIDFGHVTNQSADQGTENA